MTAVVLFVLPSALLAYPIVAQAKQITDPYMFMLSQWQHWNIFAPDPLQRSSVYRVDLLEDETWNAIHNIDYDRLPWPERAKELKILENIEENWQALVPSYLQTFCSSMHLPAGSMVRLVAVSFVLPTDLAALKHIADMPRQVSERVLGVVPCTSP